MLTKVTTFTTTVRVIDWVHRRTANGRTNTTPTCSTCFTQNAKHMFSVTDFTQGGAAINWNFTHFARAQTQSYVGTITCDDLNVGTSRTSQLAAFTWFHFYVMNR